tara:strand:- start:9 stop:230 length:222 start_codon:yes stop_codon:yes gene_type:complete
MEVSYDALRRIIQQEIAKALSVEDNAAIQQYSGDAESTRSYCKELVKGELSTEFINNLDRIEKASKGNLKKNK